MVKENMKIMEGKENQDEEYNILSKKQKGVIDS